MAVAGTLSSVHVQNEMFGADARRRPIDEAVRGALEDLPGDWHVIIREVSTVSPPWWRVHVEGGGGVFEVSFGPPDQDPETLRRRLAEAVRTRRSG
jgi:hypothetical protein